MGVIQRDQTRNQSTADYSTKRIFIWDNHYFIATYKNTTGANQTLEAGLVMCRAEDGTVEPLKTDLTNLNSAVGISAYEGSSVFPANGTVEMNVCSKGTVESIYIALPGSNTLASFNADSGLTIRDVLERVGLHLNEGTVEMTETTP